MVILLFMLQDQGNKMTMLWMFELWTTASAEWKEGLWSNEQENKVKMGSTPNPSITNGTGQVDIVGMFSFQNLVGCHCDSCMRGGAHPTKCVGAPWEGQKPYWDNSNKQSYLCKALKVAWGVRN